MYNLDNFIIYDTNNKYSDKQIKDYLINKLNIDENKAKNDIENSLKIFNNRLKKCNLEKKQEWIYCSDSCESVFSKYIGIEIKSSIFILKCIADSIITLKNNNINIKFSINTELENFKGIWKEDSKYFEIIEIGNEKNDNKSRLIMGFGPSASGKTYWAEKIIELFSKLDKKFPKTFISIDGGLYRQSSFFYKLAVESAIKICASGFLNLVLSSISLSKESLFKANKIKKCIQIFLLKESEKINISLYVPETLGDCGQDVTDLRIKICTNKYLPWLNITKDNDSWIGLLIWQHKKGSECNLPDKFKCKGCFESGKEREIYEGKKYGSSTWVHSMRMGKLETFRAPGGSFIIHNSGGLKSENQFNKTIIQDFSKTVSDDTINIFNKYESKYNYLYSISYNI